MTDAKSVAKIIVFIVDARISATLTSQTNDTNSVTFIRQSTAEKYTFDAIGLYANY